MTTIILVVATIIAAGYLIDRMNARAFKNMTDEELKSFRKGFPKGSTRF